jgi:hypothetical protein
MMPTRGAGALLLGLLLAAGPAAAGPAARVEHRDARYQVHAESVLRAEPAEVMEVLTDYANIGRIHPVVTRTEVLERRGDGARVRLLMRDCILFFCLDIHQTLHYRRTGPHRLEAEVEPAASDFRYGRMAWRVEETAPGTCHVRFDARMEPDFWLPPLIGTFALEQRLKEIALETQDNLARLVQGGEAAAPVEARRPHWFFDEPTW